MAHKTQDERAEHAALAMAAAGVSGDEVARMIFRSDGAGGGVFSLFSDATGSALIARVEVDADGNATALPSGD